MIMAGVSVSMVVCHRDRRETIFQRKIYLATGGDKLCRNRSMPVLGRNVGRRSIRRLRKIDVAGVGNELHHNKSMPLGGCLEERNASMYVSVID